ncbi:MAG: hypothetical protein AAGA54_02605 [Myxococcota bacterium]
MKLLGRAFAAALVVPCVGGCVGEGLSEDVYTHRCAMIAELRSAEVAADPVRKAAHARAALNARAKMRSALQRGDDADALMASARRRTCPGRS